MSPPSLSSIWTIVVAAGSGSRFGSETPKQFLEVAGKRVLDWSMMNAAAVSEGIVVVLPALSPIAEEMDQLAALGVDASIRGVPGGASRSESVRSGLAEVPGEADIVLVHDAARPVAGVDVFQRVIDAIEAGAAAAVPVVPVVDTLRRRGDGSTVDRSSLAAVQTPQGFAADAIRRAHASGAEATDDATLVHSMGGHVVTVPGDRWNLKLTEASDAVIIEALLRQAGSSWDDEG